ncbi:MAG: hypothetical protein IPH18_15030 [Chitinophagaceae bacterium]|nr:hypothetical protein [Chitinophagaceae bacterium]MBK8952607.1 hypothetical protein [Chitinophagaceae bacterium]
MFPIKKTGTVIFLAIAGIIAGFVFLLRGCLAQYDERFIKTPALHFSINERNIIASIVEYQRATSYSQQGGFIRKSVSTTYYLQTSDGVTAELIKQTKLKKQSAIKQYPVEMLGAAENNAWMFIGELMAFNVSTMEKTADIGILEARNPSLKNLMPEERQYYVFNRQNRQLYITAKDGSKWKIDTKTLLASPSYSGIGETDETKALELQIKNTQTLLDTLYQQKNYRPSKAYTQKIIDAAAYKTITAEFYREREMLNKVMDSLRNLQRLTEKDNREKGDVKRKIESLQHTNISFSQCKAYTDLQDSTLFLVYSEEEFAKLEERYWDRSLYDETARRKLYTGNLASTRWDHSVLNKSSVQTKGNASFLDGGLLLDKQTGLPIRLNGKLSWLVVHKTQLGKEGTILITNLKNDGTSAWSVNTALPEWNDWIFTGDYLYVFGTNNKELSSSECNILLCINLKTGAYTGYDFFTKKAVKK